MEKKYKFDPLPTTWIVSFVDLISVLIVFFLLIYASNINLKEESPRQVLASQNNVKANNIIDLDYLEMILKNKIVNFNIEFLQKNHQLILRINKNYFPQEEPLSSKNVIKIFEILFFYLREINNTIEISYKMPFFTQKFPDYQLFYSNLSFATKLCEYLQNNIEHQVNFNFMLGRVKTNENFSEFIDIIINDY